MRRRSAAAAAVLTVLTLLPGTSTADTPTLHWSVAALAAPAGDTDRLGQPALSCSGEFCALAGESGATGYVGIIDGSAVSVDVAPTPSGFDPRYESQAVNDVSCASATACTAVGYAYGGAGSERSGLAEEWNGTGWALGPNGQGNLVGCNTERCVSVGAVYDQGVEEAAVIEDRTTGGAWAYRSITLPWPPQASGSNTHISDVVCPPSGGCVALGWGNRGYQASHVPLLYYRTGDHWNAVRQVLPPNSATAFSAGALTSMSCTSALNCMALGQSRDASTRQQKLFAEVLTDGVLSAVPIALPANAASADVTARALDCSAIDDCVAVASYRSDPLGVRKLLLRYRNGVWTSRTPPRPPGGGGLGVDDVACASASLCVAVGSHDAAAGRAVRNRPAAWLWQPGTGWSARGLPAPAGAAGSEAAVLTSVQCPTTTRCVAVGTYDDGAAMYALLQPDAGS